MTRLNLRGLLRWAMVAAAALLVLAYVPEFIYDAVTDDPHTVTVTNDLTYDVGLHSCEAGNPSDVREVKAGESLEFVVVEDCAVVDKDEGLLGCLRGVTSKRTVLVSAMDKSQQPCNKAHP